jgi:hypothetical protein
MARAPLAGAFVQILSLGDRDGRQTVTSDTAGRFAFDSLARGPYAIGFFHAKLDSLGIDAPLLRVEVGGSAPVEAGLAVPSATTMVGAACGRRTARDSLGIIVGHVREVATVRPIQRAIVRARWSEIVIDRKGTRAQVQEASARTSESGWFGLCGVPRGGLLVMRAIAAGDSGGVLEVEVPDDGLLVRDLYLPSLGTTAGMPASGLRGIVRNALGDPLHGATVKFIADARETTTDDRGAFAFSTLPPGTQMIEARAIGYVPHRVPIDLFPQQVASVDLLMAEVATDIDTVRVLGHKPRVADLYAGFDRRRRLGQGIFLDPDAIEMRRPLVFTDLLRGLNGVEIVASDLVARTVAMRATDARERCEPSVVMDGIRLSIDRMNLDDMIPAAAVKAIEVYPRRSQAPPQYQSQECGTIVVWTGARGWLAGKR